VSDPKEVNTSIFGDNSWGERQTTIKGDASINLGPFSLGWDNYGRFTGDFTAGLKLGGWEGDYLYTNADADKWGYAVPIGPASLGQEFRKDGIYNTFSVGYKAFGISGAEYSKNSKVSLYAKGNATYELSNAEGNKLGIIKQTIIHDPKSPTNKSILFEQYNLYGELIEKEIRPIEDTRTLLYMSSGVATKCFCGDTQIATPAALKQVSEISVGDKVLSFDPIGEIGRGALAPKKVVRTFTNITEAWLRLTWRENDEEKELVTTPGHQFLTRNGGFREIENLVAGGKGTIVLTDGSVAEVSAERIVYSAETADMFEQAEGYVYPENGNLALKPVYKKGWKTYNFEVEDFHTYVAGGVRVHNDSYNDGVGFEYQGWRSRDGIASVELSDGSRMPLDGNAVLGYRLLNQSEAYRNTNEAIAESLAFGMGKAGASGAEIAYASWREHTYHRHDLRPEFLPI